MQFGCNGTDPDPIQQEGVAIEIIRKSCLAHSLHQQTHLIVAAQFLILGW